MDQGRRLDRRAITDHSAPPLLQTNLHQHPAVSCRLLSLCVSATHTPLLPIFPHNKKPTTKTETGCGSTKEQKKSQPALQTRTDTPDAVSPRFLGHFSTEYASSSPRVWCPVCWHYSTRVHQRRERGVAAGITRPPGQESRVQQKKVSTPESLLPHQVKRSPQLGTYACCCCRGY